MRMWMLDPRWLCRQHLLGEHKELHMLVGSIVKKKSLLGFIQNNLIQIPMIPQRHSEIVVEMLRRGYKHESPLDTEAIQAVHTYVNEHSILDWGRVDTTKSKADLFSRCEVCRERYLEAGNAL